MEKLKQAENQQAVQISREYRELGEGLTVVLDLDSANGEVTSREEWEEGVTDGAKTYRRNKFEQLINAEKAAMKTRQGLSPRAALGVVLPILMALVAGEEVTEGQKKSLKLTCEQVCGEMADPK